MPEHALLHSSTLRARTDVPRIIESLSDGEVLALLYDWAFWARPEQVAPPGDWRTWLVMAGRSFGKTRCAAEWVRQISTHTGRIALVAPTAADARDTMVEGESGLIAVFPPHQRPLYEPSKRRVTLHNGARCYLYSGEEPERLRGPQHGAAWADELAAWAYPTETWDMLEFGVRLGKHPRICVTTTPKPIQVMRDLIASPHCVVTRGSTYDNRANLPPAYFAQVIARYEGTRIGRQEIYAELLDDTPGALWQRAMFDDRRVTKAPELQRIVVAVDPSVTSKADSAECGIIVAGIDAAKDVYLLADLSRRDTPLGWATEAVTAHHSFGADRIVAEVNNGGDLVEALIRQVDRAVPYKAVHAARGKVTRAEPVAAYYEQGRVHHVGRFDELEDQMCSYVAGAKSPDRLDALVWAVHELVFEHKKSAGWIAR